MKLFLFVPKLNFFLQKCLVLVDYLYVVEVCSLFKLARKKQY